MQQTIFDQATTAEEKFQEFHEKNPQVYDKLVEMARDLHRRGHRKIGMQMLFEVIRWRTMMRTTDPDYKINNNYASRYARMIMDRNLDLDGIFETRELKS